MADRTKAQFYNDITHIMSGGMRCTIETVTGGFSVMVHDQNTSQTFVNRSLYDCVRMARNWVALENS